MSTAPPDRKAPKPLPGFSAAQIDAFRAGGVFGKPKDAPGGTAKAKPGGVLQAGQV